MRAYFFAVLILLLLVSPVFAVAPISSFTSNVTSGTSPFTVQFNDTSTNTPTSWNWSITSLNLLSSNQANGYEDPVIASFNPSGSTLARETTYFYSGNSSLKVTCNGANPYEGFTNLYPKTVVKPNTQYTFQSRLRVVSGTHLRTVITSFNSAGSYVGGVGGDDITVGDYWEWILVSQTITTGANTYYISTGIDTTAAEAATFYVDNMQLEEGGYVTEWQPPLHGTSSTVYFSTVQNPIYSFIQPESYLANSGNFTISLNASNADGYNITPSKYWINSSLPIYDYYAYGDSITADHGDDNYIIVMQDTHDPLSTSFHNTDGGGKDSSWAYEQIATHRNAKNIFIMFGVNDENLNITPAASTSAYQKLMYDYLMTRGVNTTILIQTMIGNNTWGSNSSDYINQSSRIALIQANLSINGVPFVNMFDAIDSHPRNGIVDPANLTLLDADELHPTIEGHALMAEYLWDYLSGDNPITPTPTPTPSPTPNPYIFCQNRTGNLSLYLQNSGPDWLEYNWNASANVTRVSIDSRLISDFDNATTSILISDLSQGQNHTARIYNATDYGELVCFLNIPVTTTPIPMYPVTSNTPETLTGYWWVAASWLLVVVVVFKKW